MAIIGYNAIGGSNNNRDNTLTHLLLDNATYTYVAAASQEVFRFNFYVGASYDGDGSGVDVGLYDITGGTASATLVASANISLSVSQWNTATITPVALTQGNTYAVALRIASATLVRTHSIYVGSALSSSSLTGTSALAASWTDDGNFSNVISMYAETRTSGPTLTQADDTPEDNTLQSITSILLTVAYTAVSVGGKSILSSLNNDDPETASTYTLDVFGITAQTSVPRIGETVKLSVTATGGTATQDIVIQPETGKALKTLTSVDRTTGAPGSNLVLNLEAAYGITIVIGDQFYYDTVSNTSITAAGRPTTDADFYEMVLIQGGDADNTGTGYPATINSEAQVVSAGATKTKFRKFPWQPWNRF